MGRTTRFTTRLALAAVAAAACAASAAALAGAAGPAVTPANGNDVLLADGRVYQGNDDGTWSFIPDVATANAMGIDWNNLTFASAVPEPLGEPFASVVPAVREPAAAPAPVALPKEGTDFLLPNGDVYRQDESGTYFKIPDVAAANALGVDWNNLVSVEQLP